MTPLTLRIRLDMAIWIAVFGTPGWSRPGCCGVPGGGGRHRGAGGRGDGAALVAGAALPAGRVFALTFVGLLGGLATVAVARRRRVGLAGAGPAVTGLTLAGVAGCVGFTTWYVAEYPLTPSGHPPVISATLTPVTAVVLAVVLAAGLWLAVAPPRWLAGDRRGRRFGVGIALVVVAGFVLASQLGWHGVDGRTSG